jgi:hypothetical protein
MKKTVDKSVKSAAQIAEELKAVQMHEAKIAELKKKHNVTDVFTLRIDDAVGYLRKPNRKDVSMARSLGEGDYVGINELLLDAVWLEGDERIRKDDDYFLQAIPYLDKLIEAKEVELKKN